MDRALAANGSHQKHQRDPAPPAELVGVCCKELGARLALAQDVQPEPVDGDQAAAMASINPRYRLHGVVTSRSASYAVDAGNLVRFAAYTGLRAGEIGALRVSRINLMRRRVEVSESADEAYGGFNIGPTKTYSRRSVGLPEPLVAELTPYLATKKQSDLVFEGPDGGPLRHSNWYPRHFQPAVLRAGLPSGTRFHDLRHTYAAFLIAEGAHPRAIMERMGHSTINVTLGTYGHLFPAIDAQLDQALGDRWNKARPTADAEIATFPNLNPGSSHGR